MKYFSVSADRSSGIFGNRTACLAAAAAGLFLATHPLQGQEGETIQLSPFTVDASEDVGYRATNSISGTSLNTAIKDIPMSIEVINQEFIEDTGATNFDEAMAYSSGVFLDEYTQGTGQSSDGANSPGANETSSADRSASSRGGLGGRFDNGTIIRGFNVPFQNRDGFRYGGIIAQHGVVLGGILDTANVQRMEVVRGPNSLLYGIGVLSGIVNVIPKRPLSAQSQSATVGFGSDGYLRGTFDITGPLASDLFGGQLNYRIATAQEQRDDWTDWRGKELEYYVGQLEWTSEKINILLETQYADQLESGIGDQHIHDNVFAAVDLAYRNEFGEQFNWQKDLGGLPESYRVTGPDTYAQRRETNFLANIEYTPFENFTISAGMFTTDAKEEEFNVRVATINNRERSFDLKGVIVQRPNDPNTENIPELLEWLDEFVTVNEFPGEVDPLDRRNLTDYRTVRYWWERDPEDSTTEQYRLRMTYTRDGELFGKSANHTFLVGRHDIKDEANFTTGNSRVSWQYADKQELATDDPLQFRNINDHSVIRYNGEQLSQPGFNYRNTELWFAGHYALYQGKLLNERLGIIVGARHDRYHARDRDYDRFDEIAEFGPDYSGAPLRLGPNIEILDNPNNETFGFFPLPEGVSEYTPNPDEAEKEVTKTIALNYKLTEGLTVYGVRAEGITPNTGARDGNLVGFPSEQGTSEELGIKFDIGNGKLSGTASVYRITRENALWQFTGAPAPAKWFGGIIHPTLETPQDAGFEPDLITSGAAPLSYGIDRFYFDEEGVDINKVRRTIFDDEGNPIGRSLDWPEGLLGIEGQRSDTTNPRSVAYFDYSKLDLPAVDRNDVPTGKTWRYYVEKAFADRSRDASSFNDQAGPDDFPPFPYTRTRGTTLGINPSLGGATNAIVSYTDEATGYDFQLIYAPIENWQFIFSYAHTERVATSSFNLVDAIDPASGAVFGTEYDEWVRILGRAAFGLEETDTDGDGVVDQVTKNGQPIQVGDVAPSSLMGGLEGVSLYTGSEDAASMWSKYTFREGKLKGLGAGLGVIYTGPTQTSIPIGGTDLAANRFGTPPTEERFRTDLGFSYRWTYNEMPMSLRLNVYNLMDDTKGQSIIRYNDGEGGTATRRTDVYYAPRSYRFSMGIQF